MLDFLFSYGGYTPHGVCLSWDPRLLWTHVGADVVIALSYFSIPAAMLVFLRRRNDPALTAPALLFTAFIALCGITHLMGVVTLWTPLYGLQGALKVATAVVSAVTAVTLWQMLPAALRLPSREALVGAITRQTREIDQRRRAERIAAESREVLSRKVEELQTANRELGDFAYAASHDLRSPLTSMAMLLDVLADEHGDALPPEARDDLARARGLNRRLRDLVADMSDYSEILDAAEDIREIDLARIVDEAEAALSEQMAATGAVIERGALPRIRGLERALTMLTRQLLSNALKFQPNGQAPRLRVSADKDSDGAVRLIFSDNGIGIAEQHRDRIFRLFGRLHREDEYPGTGLGLALCRRAAALHGGSIAVSESECGGTTFTIRLPQPRLDSGALRIRTSLAPRPVG